MISKSRTRAALSQVAAASLLALPASFSGSVLADTPPKPAAPAGKPVSVRKITWPQMDLDGKVTDESGKPVAGARVLLYSTAPTGTPPLSTDTDASGRFHFDGKAAWASGPWVQLLVHAEGFGVAGRGVSPLQIPGAPSPSPDIALSPATELRLRFVDAGGHPVSGASVRAAFLYKDQTFCPIPPQESAWTQKTASDGTVDFKGLPQGWGLTLQMTDDRYADIGRGGSVQLAAAARTDAPDVHLVPGAAIEGVVAYSAVGKPVAKIQVLATSDVGDYPVRKSVATDAAGRFKITQLPSGSYTISAQLPPEISAQWAAQGVTCAVPEGGRKTGVNIALIKGALISGKVAYVGTHKPAAGVNVTVGRLHGNTIESEANATTDVAGDFRARVAPGLVEIYAQVGSSGVRPQNINAVDGQTSTVSLEIPVPIPPMVVKGIVLDSAGKPVPDAQIQVSSLNWNMPPPCRTGDDGRFTLAMTDTTMAFLRARQGDRATVDETLALSGDDVTLTLANGVLGSVTGAVVDADGKPVMGATVTPIQWAIRSGENLPAATTDAVGGYHFSGLLPGVRYTFQVGMKGYGRGNIDNVVLQPGGSFTAQNVVLPDSNSFVAGHVVDSRGTPLDGATVTWDDNRDVHTTTNKQGAFRLQGVTAGKVVLEVRKDDEWTNMQVDSGKDGVVIRTTSQTAQARQMATQPKPEDSIGKQAPELAVSHWVNVSPVTLEDLHGKFIVFDCWGCCADNLFETQRIVGQLGGRGVVGIGLNVSGSSLKEVQEHVAQEHLTLPIAIDDSTAKGLGTGGFEAYALVDRAGKIAYSGWDFQQLLQTLGQKLAEEQAVAK